MVSTLPCLKATHSSQWGKREGSVNRYVPYKCSLSIDLYWKLLLVWNPSRQCNNKPEKLNDLPSCETEAQLQVVIVFFFCTSRGNSEEWKALVQLLDFFFFCFLSMLILQQLYSGTLECVLFVRLVDFLSLEAPWIAIKPCFVDVCPHRNYSFFSL